MLQNMENFIKEHKAYFLFISLDYITRRTLILDIQVAAKRNIVHIIPNILCGLNYINKD